MELCYVKYVDVISKVETFWSYECSIVLLKMYGWTKWNPIVCGIRFLSEAAW